MGALVREAIDLIWVDDDHRKRAAADILMSAPTMPVPDPDDLRRELDEAHTGRFA